MSSSLNKTGLNKTAANKIAIVGAGSWGTALAIVLSPRFERIRLWAHEKDLVQRMATTRVNDVFLPAYRLPNNVEPVSELELALADASVVLGVMPSRFARPLYSAMLPHLQPGMRFVTATKGLETGSLLRMSEVAREIIGERFEPRIAVLSGPTFAREVASGEPTALVISSADAELAASIQREFSGPTFRLYTNDDPAGVEIGAALKNTIAIGAGICQGLGLGNNSIAALITRGLVEITRLAVAMGGNAPTLAGLAGLGDLVLTCTGDLSRNRTVGIELAKGRKLTDIVSSMTMIAEGVETTYAAVDLAQRFGVDLPITQQMDSILRGGRPPREAIRELMERNLKTE
jgi:glycerol-3-phosphate dehydrogenase (NAD(P)+)